MKIRTMTTILICRATRWILRKLGTGGTNVPGTLALKLYPQIMQVLSEHMTVIIVTGTNGKTTLTRMIEKSLQESGIVYFTNKSGANMETGIATEFIMNSSLTGKNLCTHALLECDELAFRTVSKYVNAQYIVVTNIFRDQLDRCGEITYTLASILESIQNSTNATVCLNADCSLSTSMVGSFDNKTIFFGMECPIYQNAVEELSDAPYCIKCKTEYVYDFVTYGHLGKFHCPNCGYKRQDPTIAVEKVHEITPDYSIVDMRLDDQRYTVKINLPGGYNIYNAAAAACVGYAMNLDHDVIVRSLNQFQCGFGRMEKLTINDTILRMILVKNPAGCNQVLNFLCDTKEPSLFVIALNDRYADGTDISWIWDVNFEKLLLMEDHLTKILVTGIRADDMALRLKYADIPTDKITVMKDYDQLINYMANQDLPVYLMPTYTAMLDIRGKISKTFNINEFWE
ncbi:MAG: MurT ligase domain-containing protein [Lachnospiraceae bacterium]